MDTLETLDVPTLVSLVRYLTSRTEELESQILALQQVPRFDPITSLIRGQTSQMTDLSTRAPSPLTVGTSMRQNSATSQVDSVASFSSNGDRRLGLFGGTTGVYKPDALGRCTSPDEMENYAILTNISNSTLGLYRSLRDRYGWSRLDASQLVDRVRLAMQLNRGDRQDVFMSVVYEMEALSRGVTAAPASWR